MTMERRRNWMMCCCTCRWLAGRVDVAASVLPSAREERGRMGPEMEKDSCQSTPRLPPKGRGGRGIDWEKIFALAQVNAYALLALQEQIVEKERKHVFERTGRFDVSIL